MKNGILCFLLVGLLTACAGGELDPYGCTSDADCKHGRTCVDGRCQEQGTVCVSDDDCPVGQNCYRSQCEICDADSDEVYGAQCNGGDCDDANGGVHPGAAELCGDGLDNDCDGATDPASLCDDLCAMVDCPPGQACDPQTGQCVPICEPRCQGKECGPDGCGGFCGQCPSGEVCDRDGQCVSGCVDACTDGAQACMGNAVVRCADQDGDGCTEWSEPQACGAGQVCVDGVCTSCEPNCVGRECGPDGCGGSCGYCDDGEFCEDGRCTSTCRDECDFGDSYCVDEWSYVECGYWDDDWCLEFSDPIGCDEGQPCDPEQGRCAGTCWNECEWGMSICLDEYTFQMCEDFDGDGCSEWGPLERCPDDMPCNFQTGFCEGGGCWDECEGWESYCIDEWLYVQCGNWDNDPCLEFGEPMECPPDMPCDWQTGYCAGCIPLSCSDMGYECGWQRDNCGGEQYCGTCPADEFCSNSGRCRSEQGHEGAGDYCDWYTACPDDWYAAYVCVELPGEWSGLCSFPCEGQSDCAQDFPGGCCRELAPDHSVCLPQEYCEDDWPGYLESCTDTGICQPDMLCLDPDNTGMAICLLTCDTSVNVCPESGACFPLEEGAATGLCLPTGEGDFGEPCSLSAGCESGLVCIRLDEEHPGYCNRLCSDYLPCPMGFDCVLDDGTGGRWCATLCEQQSECNHLGDWECVDPWGAGTGACLPIDVP